MFLRQLHGVIFSLCQVVLRSTLALYPLVLTTTALPNEVPAPHLITHAPPPHRDAASNSHATTLVHRRQSSPRLSTQALAAIVICSTVVFCAFIGCLLQLPVAISYWRRRARSCTPTDTQGTPNTIAADLFDAETGDQPIPMARHLSPPPPYLRAPSYESNGGSSGRRSACAP